MRIGIDLGGTKIEGIALDDDGNEHARRRIPTPRDDYPGTVAAIAGLVREIEGDAGGSGTIGIGTPGITSPATGLMKNANSVCLNGQPLGAALETALGRPVRLANDANCFALSEAMDGAGRDADVVFGVIIGTGVGGGIVVGNRVLGGANGIAGEWGHNPLPWARDEERPGPSCYCGHTGCIETFLSGPGLERDHLARTGAGLTAADLADRADAGDEAADATLRAYEDRLARALATIIDVLDPEVIVLGGGLSKIKRLYDRVPDRWTQYVFSDRVDTRLVPARHGDASGVRGAAWLWPAGA